MHKWIHAFRNKVDANVINQRAKECYCELNRMRKRAVEEAGDWVHEWHFMNCIWFYVSTAELHCTRFDEYG